MQEGRRFHAAQRTREEKCREATLIIGSKTDAVSFMQSFIAKPRFIQCRRFFHEIRECYPEWLHFFK